MTKWGGAAGAKRRGQIEEWNLTSNPTAQSSRWAEAVLGNRQDLRLDLQAQPSDARLLAHSCPGRYSAIGL